MGTIASSELVERWKAALLHYGTWNQTGHSLVQQFEHCFFHDEKFREFFAGINQPPGKLEFHWVVEWLERSLRNEWVTGALARLVFTKPLEEKS